MKPQKVPHTCEVHPQTPAFISLVYSRANYCTSPQADPRCPQNDARWTPSSQYCPHVPGLEHVFMTKPVDVTRRLWALMWRPGDGPRMHNALTPGPSVPESGEELQKPSWGAGGNWTVLLSSLLPGSPRHRPLSPYADVWPLLVIEAQCY